MQKPNILIIICDQLVTEGIAAYKEIFKHNSFLAHWVETPNLDRMVNEGYSFLESHASNPVSSPCRASIFTGRYSIETGVIQNNVGIDENIPNMGQWFETNSSYNRYYCGKWHAGGNWAYPDNSGVRKIPGFETIPVGLRGTGDFNDYQVSSAMKAFLLNYNQSDPFLAVAGLMNPHDICYWTPALSDGSMVPKNDLFRLGSTRPPLPPNYEVNFNDVHAGQQVTSYTETEWQNYIYDYCRMIEKLDADVGRMLDAVDTRNDQTLVLFLSDHGEGAARHKRVQKWHPFEESVKVPLIAYMPGVVKANILDVENIVSSVDIMSTVCDYAGISTPPHSRGISLRGLMEQQENATTRDYAFVEFQRIGRMVRKGDYKYIKYYEYSGNPAKPFVRISDGQAEQFVPGPGSERYKSNSQVLLFNIKEDPWEMNDLSSNAAYVSVIDEMEILLVNEYESKIIPGTPFDRN